MALKTLAELRNNIASTTRETQVSSLVDSFINLTLAEIHNYYTWSWLRRKQTFSTVASQEDYNLDEEVDRIAIIRQISTPHKLIYLPDHLFYKSVPNPESLSTGVPYFYRCWEETGFATQNTSAEKITVVSSSTSDTSTFTVVVVGRESTNNLVVSEIITLNGTTAVTSVNTYAISGLMQCSKSAKTTGTITIKGATSATTFANIAPEESATRLKRISLYPIPSGAVTTYVEYYERLRLLYNDVDVPQMDHKWNWVLREGALAKMWEYKQSEQLSLQHQRNFEKGLMDMRAQDGTNMDYVPILGRRPAFTITPTRRFSDSVTDNFPQYAVTPW